MRCRFPCLPCVGGEHAEQCLGPARGCACRCRAMLGLEGPFLYGDPSAPAVEDQLGLVE